MPLWRPLLLCCSVLYGDELKAALEANPKHMRLDIALSLEQQNAQGGPEYVQVGRHDHFGACGKARTPATVQSISGSTHA